MIPERHIAFRLANELEGLLLGIKADGRIVASENDRIRRWLEANRPFEHIRPFSEIAAHLRHALQDGHISSDECEDLLFVISKLTTVNPYFDQIRGGLQVLMGLLNGVAADGVILLPPEREALSQWLEDWSHLKGLWPYDECETLVTAMTGYEPVADVSKQLLALAAAFPVAGATSGTEDAPPLLIGGLCAIDPRITFPVSMFVFTGDSRKGPRAHLEMVVHSLGGETCGNVRQDVDYLIACDAGSPHWAFSCYGRKVEKAYNMRREGHRIQIVAERDFWDAAADAGAGV